MQGFNMGKIEYMYQLRFHDINKMYINKTQVNS
jgi:hypothetical protein